MPTFLAENSYFLLVSPLLPEMWMRSLSTLLLSLALTAKGVDLALLLVDLYEMSEAHSSRLVSAADLACWAPEQHSTTC